MRSPPAGGDRPRVVGVAVDAVTEGETLEFIRDRIARREPAHIVTVNAEFVVRAQSDPEFHHVLETASLATPDGAGVVWALRRRGARLHRRVGGSDLIWSIPARAELLGHRVYLLGGLPGVAEAVQRRLQRTYPRLRIVGAEAGSPDAAVGPDIAERIRATRADILIVAFGAPKQEIWLARNLAPSGAIIGVGVGGSFDYVAGRAMRAPRWMQDNGLEWLWRLAREPWRWRRMVALPRFVWLVLRDRGDTGERTGDGGKRA